MFLRWKKADLVTDLTWEWKERVDSRMTPRLKEMGRWGDGAAVNLKDEVTNLLEQRLG